MCNIYAVPLVSDNLIFCDGCPRIESDVQDHSDLGPEAALQGALCAWWNTLHRRTQVCRGGVQSPSCNEASTVCLLKIGTYRKKLFILYTVLSCSRQCCGSGSISQRHGSGSGSFHHRAKIVRKTLIPTVLSLIFDFLSLKNDVNVLSKSN